MLMSRQEFTRKDVPYASVANSVLNDKRLTLKAKGLFAYLYSKPIDWNFSYERIAIDHIDGATAVLTGLRELEAIGYLTRKKNTDGTVGYHVTYEPGVENLKLGKPQVEEINTISNKELNTKKELNKNKESASAPKGDSPMLLNDFINWCKQSKQRHVNIIADYAEERKLDYTTKGQWSAFIKRNLRAARNLEPYTDDQISIAMHKVYKASYLTDWTLETVTKYLDK